MLSISIIKEKKKFENRVSLIPKDVLNIKKIGLKNIYIEKNSGKLCNYNDIDYIKYGAFIKNKKSIWNSNIILKIHFPNLKELNLLKDNSTLICLDPDLQHINNLDILKKKRITLIILKYLPRISRVQTIDVLSSISYVSGYRSVIEGIYEYRNFIGNQIFPCGKINPIKILIIGAGIFGLSAISFSKIIGASVYVYDCNKKIKDQINSLGAKFLDIDDIFLNEFLFKNINKFNIIITSAISKENIPPLIINYDLLNIMKPNRVIVDNIFKGRGNCILSKVNGLLKFNDIKIISYNDFSNLMPVAISQLYSNNIVNFLKLILDKNININYNFNDIIFKKIIVLYKGKLLNKINILNKNKKKNYVYKSNFSVCKYIFFCYKNLLLIFLFYIFILINFYNSVFWIYLNNLFIFLFSYFLGFISINKIKNFLHTPLMSLTNSISSIVIIGCLIQINQSSNFFNIFLSIISLSLVNINIFSGFFITQRILKILFH